MSSVARRASVEFDVAGFREFLDTRPPEERWELIDGVPMMAAAPRVAHQRIASNLEFHLRLSLTRSKPEWRVDREIGIEVADDSRYRPEPELAVVDRDVDPDRTFLDRFYLVAEVVSESDKGRVVDAKVKFYQEHPHARWIVVIQQDRMEIEVQERQPAGGWRRTVLTDPAETLAFGEIGAVCSLAELYRDTGLDPARKRSAGS